MKLLLLLSGKAGAGKDTFADSIASLGFHKYSFAKVLKDEALSGGWDGAKDERGVSSSSSSVRCGAITSRSTGYGACRSPSPMTSWQSRTAVTVTRLV